MTGSEIKPYHERLPELRPRTWRSAAAWALALVDCGSFGRSRTNTAATRYQEVRQRVLKLLGEQRAKDYRSSDVLTLDAPRGMCFILYLDRKRRRTLPFTPADLRRRASRLVTSLVSAVARAAFPYRSRRRACELGQGVAVHNPLLQHASGSWPRAARRARSRRAGPTRRRAADARAAAGPARPRARRTAYQPILRSGPHRARPSRRSRAAPRARAWRRPRPSSARPTTHGYWSSWTGCAARARCSRRAACRSSGRIFVNTLPTTFAIRCSAASR